MRSPVSLSLEPGLERGVPWGRDLYTFVTSAAGHMMRTLQKPRKNRPSKRQVNHRRFLHNMIQRKFADIEAANNRLASILYSTDPTDPSQSLMSPTVEHTASDGEMLQTGHSCITVDSEKIVRETQPDSARKPHLSMHKSENQKSDQNRHEFTSTGSGPQETMSFCDDEIMTRTLFPADVQANSDHLALDLDASPSFSPALSPLSLDSCDFAAQVFADISSSTPACGQGMEDIAESQWAEIIDLLGAGSSGRRGSVTVEDFLDSICDCRGEVEGGRDDGEDFSSERVQCRYDSGQEGAADRLEDIAELVSSDNAFFMSEFPSPDPSVISELQHPWSHQCLSHQCPPPHSQCTGRFELNPVPFEGVAQSFNAPSQSAPRLSIPPPPPCEGDWPFTDILTDNPVALY